jgi:hypothetical protein
MVRSTILTSRCGPTGSVMLERETGKADQKLKHSEGSVSHGGDASADFVASIRCNGQWTAEEVAEFIRVRSTLGAKVFFDPPCEPTTTAPENVREA